MALHDASWDWGDQMCSGSGLNPFRPHTGSPNASAVLPWDVQSLRSFDLNQLSCFLGSI